MQIEAIVISSLAYGEADLILRLMSKELGKLSLFARSARRSQKRFSSIPDLFDYGLFEIRKGKGSLYNIESFNSIKAFRKIRAEFGRLALASTLCESFDLLTPELMQDGQAELYELLCQSLLALNSEANNKLPLSLHAALQALVNTSGFHHFDKERKASLSTFKELLKIIETNAERPLLSAEASLDFIKECLTAKSS